MEVIPEAAVEAAGQALRDAFDWGVTDFDKQARDALEAAASHMRADAWDEGEQSGSLNHAGEEYPGVQSIPNPYRSQDE